MSADTSAGVLPRQGSRPLVVQATFHVADDEQAQTLASRMIETAHQVANLPECECDVDVSVSRPDAAFETTETPARGHPPKR